MLQMDCLYKVRQEDRYKLPIDASVEIHGKTIEAKVINISNSACLLRGGIGDDIIHANDECAITLKISEYYPSVIKRLLPKKKYKCTVQYVMWATRKEVNSLKWVVRFDEAVNLDDHIDNLAIKLHRRPILSWHLPVYQNLVVDFVDRHKRNCSHLSRGKIDDWLSKIWNDSSSVKENLNIVQAALKILDIAISRYHYTYEKCLERARNLWKKILLLPGVDNNLEKVRLFALESEAKSGHVTLYTMRVANNLSNKICREGFTNLEKDKRISGVEWIVLVDDFIGSGKTAKMKLDEFKKQATKFSEDASVNFNGGLSLLNGKKIALACFAGFHQNKSVAKLLCNFDKVLVVDELTDERDTIGSEFIKGAIGEKELAKLLNISDENKLYYNKGDCLPKGYDNLGALVSFYYNTPNNSLPILWSQVNGWKPPLPRHQAVSWRSLKPPRPAKISFLSGDEIKAHLETLNEKTKITILSKDGFEASDLSARLAIKIQQKECITVIWHEFAQVCSVESFFSHISWYLEKRCCLGELKTRFFKGESDAKLIDKLVEILQKLRPALFLDGIDKIKDKRLQDTLNSILSKLGKSIKVVCTSKQSLPVWYDSFNMSVIELGRLENEKLEAVITQVVGKNNSISQEIKDMIIARSWDRFLVTWILSSFYLKIHQDDNKFKASFERWDEGLGPLIGATRVLFNELDTDVQKFLQAASIFECPFEYELLEAMYEYNCKISKLSDCRSVYKCIDYLKICCTPFLFEVDGDRFEMPRVISEVISKELRKENPNTFIDLEKKAGRLFAALDTQEVGHKLDYLEIAHNHYLEANSIDEAIGILWAEQTYFISNGRSERLLQLVELTWDKNPSRGNRHEDLMYLRAKLLRRVTQHINLRKLCREATKVFPEMTPYRKAQFYYLEATASACIRKFDESWKCFNEAKGFLSGELNGQEERLLIRLGLRCCQTYMSQGQYFLAWNELSKTVELMGFHKSHTYKHEVAVACRHLYTLLYLSGEYIDALGWAEDAFQLNKRVGDKEGVAIMQYKLARVWFSLGDLNQADYFCSKALETMERYIVGGRWWQMAFLETKALIAIKKAHNTQVESEKEEFWNAAQFYINKAEEMSLDISLGSDTKTTEKIFTIRPHLSEIRQAESHLLFDRRFVENNKQKCDWKHKWKEALGFLYQEDSAEAKCVKVEDAISQVQDKYRLSELIYDRALFLYDSVNMLKSRIHGFRAINKVINLLRDSANILVESDLFTGQKKPLEQLARIAKIEREYLPQVEALYRIHVVEIHKDEKLSAAFKEMYSPLKNLLKKQGEDPRGLQATSQHLKTIEKLRKEIEISLSRFIKTLGAAEQPT